MKLLKDKAELIALVLEKNTQLAECYHIILLLEGEKGLFVLRAIGHDVPQTNIDRAFTDRHRKAGEVYFPCGSCYTKHIGSL